MLTDTYSEPRRISKMEIFVKIVNSFQQNALSEMFGWVLNTPLTDQSKSRILTYFMQWKTNIYANYYVVQLSALGISTHVGKKREEKVRDMSWSYHYPKVGWQHHRYFTFAEISQFPWEYITALIVSKDIQI